MSLLRRCRRVHAALAITAGLWIGCADPPPNLVLVIGDDQGFRDFGFMGHTVVETPHLDRLAAEGVVFPAAFNTASSCRPSLRSLLTGLHPIQWSTRVAALSPEGVARADSAQIVDLVTLPRRLASQGYASFQGGKYWEGRYDFAGFSHGMTDEIPEKRSMRSYSGAAGLALGRETMQPLWDFLEAHARQPFFVWFAPKLPHSPFDAGPEFADRYRGRGLAGSAEAYYANVTRFDARVGELLDRLDGLGLRERTLVVMLTDNGWEQLPHSEHGRLGGPRGKFSIHEQGFRTPLVMRWPGHIPAGSVRDDLVSSVDLFPTFLELAGAAPAPGRVGVSLVPSLLRGAASPRRFVAGGMQRLRSGPSSWPRERDGWFLQTRSWRYVAVESDERRGEREERLFDLVRDPEQSRDLGSAEPARLAEMREQLDAWRTAVTEAARER